MLLNYTLFFIVDGVDFLHDHSLRKSSKRTISGVEIHLSLVALKFELRATTNFDKRIRMCQRSLAAIYQMYYFIHNSQMCIL